MMHTINKTSNVLHSYNSTVQALSKIQLGLGILFVRSCTLVGHYLPFKHRHFLTRSNRLRARYCLLLFVSLSSMTGFGFIPLSNALIMPPAYLSYKKASLNQQSRLSLPVIPNQDGDTRYPLLEEAMLNQPQADKAMRRIDEAPVHKTEMIKIRSGDTLSTAFSRAGIDHDESMQVSKLMKEHFDPRNLRPGHVFTVSLKRNDPVMNSHNAARKPSYKIEQISFDINPLKTLKLLQDGKGNFDGKITQKPLFRKEYAAHISVDGSLYGSAARAGVKSSVVSEAIRLYSWGVDFERDLKKGDRLDIFFSQEETQNGEMSQNPVVEYASLTVKGKTRSIYRHERLNGQVAYFDEKGQSLRRTLMKTPIDGARVSSGFGMRRHPVLGYSKMHKGIDFSAPRGTPIYAAGDGVIEKAGRNGSYGNYVAIRHNKTFKTAYAHMNGFAKGIRSGTRVSQGQVIGYVGTTGRSTGPHLHYEILKNGQQINPNRVDLPIGEVLEARELRRFRNNVKNYNAKFKKLDVSTTIVADAGKNEPVNQ